jgi:hypothetical protein
MKLMCAVEEFFKRDMTDEFFKRDTTLDQV